MRNGMAILAMILGLMLSGCGAVETFETIADEHAAAAVAEHRAVALKLPGEAASSVMEGESGQLYLCDDYEIFIQTMAGGDLERTIKTVSGYDADVLTVMETESQGMKRYDFVWTAAGEQGSQIARAAVLDDGNYHYVLTTMCAAADAGDVRSEWDTIFQSFGLN